MNIDDWRDKIIREQIGDWFVIRIPKGTILYTGNNLPTIGNLKSILNYFSTFPVACHYAFNSMSERPVNNPDYRCVYSYILNQDLVLLDMENKGNYHKLNPLISYDYFASSFNNGVKRISYNTKIDDEISSILCSIINNLDGYAYTEYMNNHNEIMLCNTHKINMLNYQYLYRYIRADNNFLYETDKLGNITSKINISKDIIFNIGKKVIPIKIQCDPTLFPYGYDKDHNINNLKTDNFLKNNEVNEIMIEYIKKYIINGKYNYEIMYLYPKSYDYYSDKYEFINGKKLKKCKVDEERNPETNKCRKKCKESEIRDPETNRCRKKGEIRDSKTNKCK